MSQPDACHILTAEQAAAKSPCPKSKRGVALFAPDTGAHHGEGWNGPPGGAACPGLAVCGKNCNKLCVHAEIRALRSSPRHTHGGGLHLVHVKLGTDDHVTPSSPPKCWQCSREILDVGFVAGVWLYEEQPEEWCPHIDEKRTDCGFCQGGFCMLCDPRMTGVPCGHDVLDRHGDLPIVNGLWRYYTAEEFHRATRRNAGLP